MSPWNVKQRSMGLLYTGVVLVVVALVMGYLALTGVIGNYDGGDDDGSRPGASTPTGTPTTDEPTDPPPGVLDVVSWGRSSGQLALVVRNISDQHVDRVRVRITARDADGDVLLTTTGTPRDVCCTVVGLPPDGQYGLFAEVAPDVGQIDTVEVVPFEIEGRRTAATPRVTTRDPRLMRSDDDTVVTAVVTARGWLSGYMAVQAILTDADRKVAQVISGRFYCFEAGKPQEVRLQLFHSVPRSLQLARVLAHPIPDGVPAHVAGRCD